MPLAAIDWTSVIDTAISALAALVAGGFGWTIRRSLRTPSGDPIGHVVERTHDLAAVAVLPDEARKGVEMSPTMLKSVERINGDPQAPVKVNGETAASVPPPEA